LRKAVPASFGGKAPVNPQVREKEFATRTGKLEKKRLILKSKKN